MENEIDGLLFDFGGKVGAGHGRVGKSGSTIEPMPKIITPKEIHAIMPDLEHLHSDVDIVLYGDLNPIDVERVISHLDKLPLVYKFDVVAYGLVKNPALRQHIERVAVSIYEKRYASPPGLNNDTMGES